MSDGKRIAKGKMKTLDLVLLGLGLFMAAFIVTMIVIFCVKGSVPDTLITMTMGGGGLECVATTAITIAKKKYEKEKDFDGMDEYH